jgi:hypothetical protein
MMTIVKNSVEKANSLFSGKTSLYMQALVLTDKKKNCSELGRTLNVSHDRISRCLDEIPPKLDQQISLFIGLAKEADLDFEKAFLIGDDTTLRHYANHMEAIGPVYSSSESKVVTGHNLVVLCISDGRITLPIAHDFYIPKRSANSEPFRTKIQIMQDLIKRATDCLSFNYVFLDGLYQSKGMMEFLDRLPIQYLMRLPKNRTVRTTADEKPIKIGKHSSFKLNKNRRSYARKALIAGKERYIAAEKRMNSKGDYETVYLISNFETEPKKYIDMYLLRWPIEQVFRSCKQMLGLGDCQSQALSKQRAHIFSVFAAFAIAEQLKGLYKLAHTPDGIRLYRAVILESKECSS